MAPTINGMDTKYIDITPTWRGAMTVCIAILMGDSDPEAKQSAADQILQLADAVDEHQHRYVVWAGGVETDYYMTKDNAERTAARYRAEGYDDVVIVEKEQQ